MALALFDTADGNKVDGAFPATFVHYTMVTSTNVVVKDKVLHSSNAEMYKQQYKNNSEKVPYRSSTTFCQSTHVNSYWFLRESNLQSQTC
jgi:hypothetical protein